MKDRTGGATVFHKIRPKFSRILNLQAEALTVPTFTAEVVSRLIQILDNIRTIDEETRFNPDCNKNFLDRAAKFMPEVMELLHSNFLPRTVVCLQEKVGDLFTQLSRLGDGVRVDFEMRRLAEKIGSQMKQIMPSVLGFSCRNVSKEVFSNVQQTLHGIGLDLSRFPGEKYTDLARECIETEAMVRHVAAAHSFIRTCESIQNDLRKNKQNLESACLPLMSHQVLLEPKKPKIRTKIEQKECRQIQVLLSQFKTMSKDEFCTEFREKMSKCFNFTPPISAIREVAGAIVQIRLPSDLKTKLFERCVKLCDVSCEMFQRYQLLSDRVTSNDSSLRDFLKSVDVLEEEIYGLTKSKKKPNGFTAEKSRHLESVFDEFLSVVHAISQGAEFAEQANNLLRQKVMYLDLSGFKMGCVDTRFTEVLGKNDKSSFVNLLSCINMYSDEFPALKHQGIDFVERGRLYVCHPPSLKLKYQSIVNLCERLEPDLFTLSGTAFDYYPISSTGSSVLSALSQFQQDIGMTILHMERIPLSIVSLRVLAMTLYKHGFPPKNDELIDGILKELLSLFDLFVVFMKFHDRGALSISSFCQLTYLTTICDDLSDECVEFVPFVKYFGQLNVFDIDNDALKESIRRLQELIMKELSSWQCSDISKELGNYTRELSMVTSMVQKNHGDDIAVKLLTNFSSWVACIQREKPTMWHVRETQIKMRVLKKLFLRFVESNKDNKSQIPTQEILKLLELCTKLRVRFEYKRKLKQFLEYVEQINVDDSSEAITSSVADVDNGVREKGEMDSESNAFSLFGITEAERSRVDPAYDSEFLHAEMAIGLRAEHFSPCLIYEHFQRLLTTYVQEWAVHGKFRRKVVASFESMRNESVDMTLSGISQFFTSNYENFEAFGAQMAPYFRHRISKCLGSLASLSAKSNPAPTAIADVRKQLQNLKKKVEDLDFLWCEEFLALENRLAPISGPEMDFILFEIMALWKESYLCFQCSRCFKTFVTSSIHFGPDLALIRSLLGYLLDTQSLWIPEFTKQNQVDTILKLSALSDESTLDAAESVLKETAMCISKSKIVEMLDTDFFDFASFLGKLDPHVTSFEAVATGRFFSLASTIRKSLFELLSHDYDNNRAREAVERLDEFESQLKLSSVRFETHLIVASMTAVKNLQVLDNLGRAFENFDVFHTKETSDNLVPARSLIFLRMAVFALENRIRNLFQLSPTFSAWSDAIAPVISVIDTIPDVFGLIPKDSVLLHSFTSAWKTFCDSLSPLSLADIWDRFVQAAKKILSELRKVSDERSRLFDSIEILVEAFNIGHDPSEIFRIQLLFMFVEIQSGHFRISVHELPFAELKKCLSIILLFNDACCLIQSITTKVNSLIDDSKISCPQSFLAERKELVERQLPDPKDSTLEKALSMREQTAVAFSVKSMAEANQIDKERLTALPGVKRSVRDIRELVDTLTKENAFLLELNHLLGSSAHPSPLRNPDLQPPMPFVQGSTVNSSEITRSRADGELERIAVTDEAITEIASGISGERAKIESIRTKYVTDGLFIDVHRARRLREEFAASEVDLSSSDGRSKEVQRLRDEIARNRGLIGQLCKIIES